MAYMYANVDLVELNKRFGIMIDSSSSSCPPPFLYILSASFRRQIRAHKRNTQKQQLGFIFMVLFFAPSLTEKRKWEKDTRYQTLVQTFRNNIFLLEPSPLHFSD